MDKPSRTQVLNVVLFLALFVSFSVLYFINETTEFMKGSTTFASRTEEVNKFEIPVLVICFEPKYKPSIYGNSNKTLHYYFYQDIDLIKEEQKRQKLADFLKSASYKLNEDIQIELKIGDGYNDNKAVKYDLEDGRKAMDNFKIDVYQTYTLNYGICYVIESTEKVSPWIYMTIFLKNLNSENGDKLSKVNLFIAAHETWYGITSNIWPYFELEKHSFSFNKPKTSNWIDMYVTSISYQKGHKSVEGCIENWMSTNDVCKKCSPFFLSLKTKNPSCQSNEDNTCWYSWTFYGKNSNNYKKCLKPLKTTLYKAKPQSFERALIQNDTVELLFTYASDEIKIEEETLMIGTSSYIGSVGGSLGLFLGFSCFTSLSCCLQKIFELCDKFQQ